jgi:hypothetical protein
METGTLKDLNVQPGDKVICVEEGSPHVELGKSYDINDYRGVVGLRIGFFTNSIFRIISRANEATPQPDLTAIKTPFDLLDEATMQDLMEHGGPYQQFHGCWRDAEKPFHGHLAIRVKPAPKVETVTMDASLNDDGHIYHSILSHYTHVRVTFNGIDGVIDLASYRVEAR